MASRYEHRLDRIERKIDYLTEVVYEMRGELTGYKKYTTFVAGIVSMVISSLLTMIGIRR